LRPHPYCKECGVVKNVSVDKARKIGYYVNALAEIKRRLDRLGVKVSRAQTRLVLKELEGKKESSDSYFVTGGAQRSIFVKAVRKYLRLSPGYVESFLR
jgi:hypothetical protein